TPQIFVRDVTREPDTIGKPQITGYRFELVTGVAFTDKDAKEVSSALIVYEMVQSSEEIVDSILRIHGADVAKNDFALALESCIGFDQSHAGQVGAVADNEQPVGVDGVAPDGDGSIALIRHDRDVREFQREPLEEHEASRHQAMSRLLVAGEIELWRQIVMVEDEPLSEKSVNSADDEERVRRVVGMDDVEALPRGDPQTPTEARRGEIDIFEYVASHRLQNFQKRR